ncbi:MAG: hypothetical protein V4505_25765 [Pseudomonadota bacterium]
MKCPACCSDESKVATTKHGPARVSRLRDCIACGHRWHTVEVDAQNLARMESAAAAVRTFASISKELDDAAAAHG